MALYRAGSTTYCNGSLQECVVRYLLMHSTHLESRISSALDIEATILRPIQTTSADPRPLPQMHVIP